MVNVGKYTSPMDLMGYIYILYIPTMGYIYIYTYRYPLKSVMFGSLENHLKHQRLLDQGLWAQDGREIHLGWSQRAQRGLFACRMNFSRWLLMDGMGFHWSQDFRFGIDIITDDHMIRNGILTLWHGLILVHQLINAQHGCVRCWKADRFWKESAIFSWRISLEKLFEVYFEWLSLKLTFSPLKMNDWKTSFLLGWPIFRGYVSSPESIKLKWLYHQNTWIDHCPS